MVNLHNQVRKLVRKEKLLERVQEIRAKEMLDMVNQRHSMSTSSTLIMELDGWNSIVLIYFELELLTPICIIY